MHLKWKKLHYQKQRGRVSANVAMEGTGKLQAPFGMSQLIGTAARTQH